MADQDADDVGELYQVPIMGPASSGMKLTDTPVSGGDVFEFQISRDSNRVVFRADLETDDRFELYSVPLIGPADACVKLNTALGDNGDVTGFTVSPDGRWVAYRADPGGRWGLLDEVYRLYRVPIDGPSTESLLFSRLALDCDVRSQSFAFTPDSARIVYMADQDTDEVDELYVSYIPPAVARRWEVYR
jgi:Tol biopolymer transport system component